MLRAAGFRSKTINRGFEPIGRSGTIQVLANDAASPSQEPFDRASREAAHTARRRRLHGLGSIARGLGLKVMPSGSKSWKFLYSRHGRSRWLHLGVVGAVDLAGARALAAEAALEVARRGKDPAADRAAARATGTFADLAERYRETYAKRRNRSSHQLTPLCAAAYCRHGVSYRLARSPVQTCAR